MKNDTTIREADKMHREAIMSAMRSTGWKRKIGLLFARFFSHVGDEMRRDQADELRGKDDKYHDQY
jgi:hypothetical protein